MIPYTPNVAMAMGTPATTLVKMGQETVEDAKMGRRRRRKRSRR